jgi:pyridoxine 5-phosphate synthase
MDPQPLSSIDAAAQVGADRIELHTETYARAWERGEPETVLPEFTLAAERAQAAGLGVNAGHDLDLINLGPLLATVPDVLEVSIGHALTVEALQSGWQEVVRRYLAIVSR